MRRVGGRYPYTSTEKNPKGYFNSAGPHPRSPPGSRFQDHLVERVKTSRRFPRSGGRQWGLASHLSPPEQLPPRLHQHQTHLPAWHLPKAGGRGHGQGWKQTLCCYRHSLLFWGQGSEGLWVRPHCVPPGRLLPSLCLLKSAPQFNPAQHVDTLNTGLDHSQCSLTAGF